MIFFSITAKAKFRINTSFTTYGFTGFNRDPIRSGISVANEYFDFYTDGFEEIPQIVVTAQDGAEGIAVGEFGIFVGPVSEPVPISSFALYLGLLLMVTFGAYRLRRII